MGGGGLGPAPHGSRPHLSPCSQASEPPGPGFTGLQQLREGVLLPIPQSRKPPQREGQSGDLCPQNRRDTVGGLAWESGGGEGGAVSLTPMGTGTDGALLQVTVIVGASQDIIPQLKKKYDVDTLDMVFLDHWKDRYLPDTILLEVSCARSQSGCAGCRDALAARPVGLSL